MATAATTSFAWDPCLAGETILIGSVETVRDQIQQLIQVSGINYFVGSFAWGSLSPEHSRASLGCSSPRSCRPSPSADQLAFVRTAGKRLIASSR